MIHLKLYVGTYTRPTPYLAESNGEGLYILDFDEASGALSMAGRVPGIENPSYLCISPDGRNVHAVWEVPEWPEGLVSSYAIDQARGELSHLGVQGSRGTATCYVSMDSKSRAAVLANYGSGSVALLPARADGSLAEATTEDQHEGGGPDAARQEGPHAHCIVISPDDRFAFSADLGTDSIYGYHLDYEAMTMERASELKLPAGAGPRHLAFAPSARHAYAICELESSIAALAYDAASGELSHIETVSTLPADYDGENTCADIRIHPSGRFVYGSNRGHDSVTMFAVDAGSGRLGLIGHRSTEGATPRNFAISPDGRFVLVANQDSDNIVTMPIDPATGELGETVAVAEVPTPVCLEFGL